MKSYFILLGLIFLTIAPAIAYKKTYITTYPNKKSYYQKPFFRQTYNPYGNYASYQQYKRLNKNNSKRLERIKKIRKMNRLKQNISPYLSLLKNKYSGALTGYSTPINQNIYNQIGIDPYNPSQKTIKQIPKSPNCNMDLYGLPSGNEMYYRNGSFYRDLGGISGKTGVTIIYD